jgi:hypothetical protein
MGRKYQILDRMSTRKSGERFPCFFLLCRLHGKMVYVQSKDAAQNAPLLAIEQRVMILKAFFVEANRLESERFLDQGLVRYDQAGKRAKSLLEETR